MVGENIGIYVVYLCFVGETGGKDFVVVYRSVDLVVFVMVLVWGVFEY